MDLTNKLKRYRAGRMSATDTVSGIPIGSPELTQATIDYLEGGIEPSADDVGTWDEIVMTYARGEISDEQMAELTAAMLARMMMT